MRFTITTPVRGFRGEVAGVAFIDSRAEVDEDANARAIAYFRRKGYGVEPIAERGTAHSEPAPGDDSAGEMPRKSASKSAWVAYAVSQDVPEGDADNLTRDQLVELFATGDGEE